MATGVVRLGTQVPKDAREWERVLRTLNTAVRVDADGNVIFEGVAPNTVAFVIIGSSSAVPNARGLAVTSELTLTDNGAGSSLQIGVAPTIARDTEVTTAANAAQAAAEATAAAALTAHEGASNPHPTYLTQAEGDARYSQFASGTATPSLTGMTTVPTPTIRYTKVGNLVTVYFPETLATSNSTEMQLTGFPAAITPARTQRMLCRVRDNGTVTLGVASIGTGSDMVFGLNVSYATTGFTNSGSKGIEEQVLSWTLD